MNGWATPPGWVGPPPGPPMAPYNLPVGPTQMVPGFLHNPFPLPLRYPPPNLGPNGNNGPMTRMQGYPPPPMVPSMYPASGFMPVPMYPKTQGPDPSPPYGRSQGAERTPDLKAIEDHIHELLLWKKSDEELEVEKANENEFEDEGNDEESEYDDEQLENEIGDKRHLDESDEIDEQVTYDKSFHEGPTQPAAASQNQNSSYPTSKRWVVKNKTTPSGANNDRTEVKPGREALDRLTEEMIRTAESLMPLRNELERKLVLVKKLQAVVNRLWPDYHPKLHLFGSSANDLCLKNGDIDLCMTIDKRAGTKKKIVNKLANILRRNGMKKVLSLSQARVPIVKFDDPVSRFSCDICINNVLALHNTRLIEAYGRIDSRVKLMAYVVKHWAKRRKLNEPYRGTLSSYAWVLLVINFLQQRQPPILPCLQTYREVGHEEEELPVSLVRGYNCYFYPHADKLHDFGMANTETLGELLLAFFEIYAHSFEYPTMVVSVRVGGYLTKKEKHWERSRTLRDNHWFSIEDPFETSHDLGRVVDRETLRAIRWELRRAYRTLCDTSSLPELLKPYKENNSNN